MPIYLIALTNEEDRPRFRDWKIGQVFHSHEQELVLVKFEATDHQAARNIYRDYLEENLGGLGRTGEAPGVLGLWEIKALDLGHDLEAFRDGVLLDQRARDRAREAERDRAELERLKAKLGEK